MRSQNAQFLPWRLRQHTFPEIFQARQFDSLIPRIQTEKPKLFLLWLHLHGDSDGSKWLSGGVSHLMLLLSQLRVEKLLADALLDKEGPDVIWVFVSLRMGWDLQTV